MKKTLLLLFIAACFIVSLIPSVGMIFNPTTQTIGNERETAFPSVLNEDGKVNTDYMGQLGDYFGKHFAFRPQIITADAKIQSKLFMSSNIPSVISGKNGWLFYSSTADDFTGENPMTEGEVMGVVNNLRIIQEFSQSKGIRFLFTVAPNKNTLYPDNMPYYYREKGSVHNRDTVSNALEKSEVNYCNLFNLFASQSETLYFSKDSHWNNKGALSAFNCLTDYLKKSHDDFQSAQVVRKKDFTGDLSKMIFPSSAETEFNFYYGAEEKYTYVTDTLAVEEPLIQTRSDSATGTLYMYRDSFGNALLPFFAGAYGASTFTKSFPMILDKDLEKYAPDTFIMEIAERNINWLIQRPPVFLSPQITVFKTDEQSSEQVKANIALCEYSPDYIAVSGTLDRKYSEAEAVYVTLKCKDGTYKTRECYTIFDEQERQFLAYFDSQEIDMSKQEEMSVIIKDGEKRIELSTVTTNLGGTNENFN